MPDTLLLIAGSSNFNNSVGGSLLFAIICAVIAPGRGRSALAWFFLGLFFSCIALIILLLIPDLKAEAERQSGADRELHRLREQVKKERHVADGRHEGHRSRLDAHDRALGVDTTEEEPQRIDSAPPPAAQIPPLPPDDEPGVSWLFLEGEDQLGPVTTAQLRAMWDEGRITPSTLVWREGMSEWVEFGKLPRSS